MFSYMMSPSAIEHVGAGRLDQRREPVAAKGGGRVLPRAAAVVEPGDEVRPPAAFPGRRCLQPLLRIGRRSEEHTSELQSHHDLVCRLLLEKKKKNQHH